MIEVLLVVVSDLQQLATLRFFFPKMADFDGGLHWRSIL